MKQEQTKTKIRQLMAIFSRLGINDEMRHDIVHNYTNGRTNSTRQLSESELNGLMWRFQSQLQSVNNSAVQELERKQKRSTVLAIAQRCGIHSGTSFDKFNSFMMNKSVHKKELHKYTLEELDELIKQFRGLERNYRRSAEQVGTKAYNHAHGWAEVSTN